MIVSITLTYKGGHGIVQVSLLRNGSVITMQSCSTSGTITFNDALHGDLISLDGVSPLGGTDVNIDTPTGPPTPDHYNEGVIAGGYIIL